MELWIFYGNCVQEAIKLTEEKPFYLLYELKNLLESKTKIEQKRAKYYFNGKRVYKIEPKLTSFNNYLQILEIRRNNPIEITVISDLSDIFPLNIVLENKENKIVLDCLLELCLLYDINDIFSQELEIKTNDNQLLDFFTPLHQFPNEIHISLNKPLADQINIIVKLFRNVEILIECSHDMKIRSLKCLIALYLKLHPKKINIQYNHIILIDGTLESNDIDEGDYLMISEVEKTRYCYIRDNS